MLKTYPSNFMYIILVVLSSLIILSSNNWFLSWVGLEMSLFGFLPLFMVTPLSSEGMMKYFLTQASGSIAFLASILASSMKEIFIILAMSMKLGMFPFIQWMPLVMAALSWTGCLILTTLQKIGPLMILLQDTSPKHKMYLGAFSLFFSSVLGFNQAMFRTLLSYSSIMHSSWLMLTTIVGEKMLISYMSLYMFLTAYLFFSLYSSENDSINNMKTHTSETQIFMLLILAGFPPFSMFLLKMMMIFLFSTKPLIMMILLLSTSISIFFYLSISLPMMMKKPNIFHHTILLNLLPLVLFF